MTPTTEQAREALADWKPSSEWASFMSDDDILAWVSKYGAIVGSLLRASAEPHPDVERLMAAVRDLTEELERSYSSREEAGHRSAALYDHAAIIALCNAAANGREE